MVSYSILWKTSAIKEMKNFPKKDIQRIVNKVNALERNPVPPGSLKLAGSLNTHRLRIGNYRVIYNLFEKILTIEIIRVRHRKDVYNS
jgi:mRNA interferase RelE/StbE